MVNTYQPGDLVKIIVGAPHTNIGQTARVDHIKGNDVVVTLVNDTRRQWSYFPWEIRKVKS